MSVEGLKGFICYIKSTPFAFVLDFDQAEKLSDWMIISPNLCLNELGYVCRASPKLSLGYRCAESFKSSQGDGKIWMIWN